MARAHSVEGFRMQYDGMNFIVTQVLVVDVLEILYISCDIGGSVNSKVVLG